MFAQGLESHVLVGVIVSFVGLLLSHVTVWGAALLITLYRAIIFISLSKQKTIATYREACRVFAFV